IKKLLGDPDAKKETERSLPLVDRLEKHFAALPEDHKVKNHIANLTRDWVRLDADKMRRDSAAVLTELTPLRNRQGSVAPAQAPGKLKTPGHFEPGKLPAGNVAALGRTLFTDYLVPVELAATLLLVATIGAIVIAGRRSEELR